MSLTEFKLNQIKTGHSCLFVGQDSSQLASKLVCKKVEFGMNKGLLLTHEPSKYQCEHHFTQISGLGKKNVRNFHKGQVEGQDKKILVVDNVKVLPARGAELVALVSDSVAMSKSLVVCVFEKNEDVPNGLKEACSHVFRLSEGYPTVVETEGQVFHM